MSNKKPYHSGTVSLSTEGIRQGNIIMKLLAQKAARIKRLQSRRPADILIEVIEYCEQHPTRFPGAMLMEWYDDINNVTYVVARESYKKFWDSSFCADNVPDDESVTFCMTAMCFALAMLEYEEDEQELEVA
jgi:hypothetical protein